MSWVPDGENPFGDNSQHGNPSPMVPLVSSSTPPAHSGETPPWLMENSQQKTPSKVTMQLPNSVSTPVSNVTTMGNNASAVNINVVGSGSGGGIEASQDR